MRSLTKVINQWDKTRNTAIALVDGSVELTWGNFANRVASLASIFQARGIKQGERVAVLGQNSHRLIETLYGALWAGGVAVPLNWRLATPELIELCHDCEPTLLVVDEDFKDQAQTLAQLVPSIRSVIHQHDYESLVASGVPVSDAGRSNDDVAFLIYTGGTTGRPKGVMITHSNLIANFENCLAILPFDEKTVHLHCGALFHLSALWRVVSVTLLGGQHIVLPRFEVEPVLDAIERYQITAAAFVPTMMAALLDSPNFTQEKLSSLRAITYGTSPVSDTLLLRLMQALPACGLYQGYGMTETSPVVTLLTPNDHKPGNPRLRSCGQAVPGVEVRIADASDALLPQGTVGEIQLRGATVMKGYWQLSELTNQTLRGGWMHTGDAGYFDEQGYLYIVDRLKDMIVSGGENIYSFEVENAIASHPDVAECAVFGIPDEKWGEAVHAVVVPKANVLLDTASVSAHCRARIASYKCPKSIEVRLEPLPLSAVNKVLKASLRTKWWSGQERNIA
ncbi:long-chain fatty acid--CoA ligase [Alcaligenaceae bacterium]|nr:long-chain fatty acid--CoA ligase [Alcaligenaceae bacterium]